MNKPIAKGLFFLLLSFKAKLSASEDGDDDTFGELQR